MPAWPFLVALLMFCSARFTSLSLPTSSSTTTATTTTSARINNNNNYPTHHCHCYCPSFFFYCLRRTLPRRSTPALPSGPCFPSDAIVHQIKLIMLHSMALRLEILRSFSRSLAVCWARPKQSLGRMLEQKRQVPLYLWCVWSSTCQGQRVQSVIKPRTKCRERSRTNSSRLQGKTRMHKA